VHEENIDSPKSARVEIFQQPCKGACRYGAIMEQSIGVGDMEVGVLVAWGCA
jgi:hypothetical protein